MKAEIRNEIFEPYPYTPDTDNWREESENGWKVPTDDAEGFKWFHKATEQGQS